MTWGSIVAEDFSVPLSVMYIYIYICIGEHKHNTLNKVKFVLNFAWCADQLGRVQYVIRWVGALKTGEKGSCYSIGFPFWVNDEVVGKGHNIEYICTNTGMSFKA